MQKGTENTGRKFCGSRKMTIIRGAARQPFAATVQLEQKPEHGLRNGRVVCARDRRLRNADTGKGKC